ncbi:helix-turn-helix domain-containing protein [Streptomyces noursei]|uniref:helix-turn-helix domain-containing protein n=1 Tax=Streptomyces noursei TaxID=1971 RepID=UPI0016720187|nr:hypothetical protein [Streptomyces noursei]MCZ1014044.1 hypothetical protein [Streptomyces noursei]
MPPPTDDTALRRLADHVKRRRVELGMNKIDVAKVADITINTYMKIEDARPVRELTYGKVEKVLKWAPGSAHEVLRGRQPTIIEELSSDVVVSPVNTADLEADVAQAVSNAAIAVTDGLSAADIRKLKVGVIEELRRMGRLPKRDD